jgi:small-conductance mechanosensitive channel
VQVTLGYDVDKDYAQTTLIEAALKTDGILFSADKSPFVLLRELGSYSITYEINAYIDEPNRLARIKSDLISNMITELKRAGIDIATPTIVTYKRRRKNTTTHNNTTHKQQKTHLNNQLTNTFPPLPV